jgi:hypothetical protein
MLREGRPKLKRKVSILSNCDMMPIYILHTNHLNSVFLNKDYIKQESYLNLFTSYAADMNLVVKFRCKMQGNYCCRCYILPALQERKVGSGIL